MTGPVINFKDLNVPVDRTPMTRDFFNTRFQNVANAINGIAGRMDAYDLVVNALVQLGMDRVNTVLGPLLGVLQQAAQSGFLTADAEGLSVSLTEGVDVQFTITSGGLAVFTPTPYLLALDETDSTNWGILSLNAYDNVTGILAGHCIYSNNGTQASNRWSLSAQSALIAAQMNMLAETVSARTDVLAATATVTVDYAAIEAAIAAIHAGPVISVAGKTGAVTLVAADVAGVATSAAITAAITALGLGSASTHASTDFVAPSRQVTGAGLATGGGDLSADRAVTVTGSTLAQAQGGTDNTTAMTPLRVKNALDFFVWPSPAFTGTPTAPTAAPGTNTTQLATTAFVHAAGTDVQYFTAGGTWTKPAGAKATSAVYVEVSGGGGGGGSGATNAVSTAKIGGPGGGGAAVVSRWFRAGDLSATETVTIGASGTGGAAVTASTANGIAGGNGGNSTCTTGSSQLTSTGGGGGGIGVLNRGGVGGGVSTQLPGSITADATGFEGGNGQISAVGGSGIVGGGAGGGTINTGGGFAGGGSLFGSGGGGGGGCETSANVLGAPAAGGGRGQQIIGLGGAAGVSSAGAPTTPSAPSALGFGGGGGGSSQTANAAAGAAGSLGGGGGGGGSARNTFQSGAGGVGGGGYVIVITVI